MSHADTERISELSGHVLHTLQFTEDIVKNFPGRLAGSASCNQAGEAIAREFESHCDEHSVKRESFDFHPRACTKSIRPMVLLYCMAVVFMFLKMPPWASLCLGVSLLLFFSQIIFYKKIFDPFFPRAKGYNIRGVVEPAKEVRQQIILCGHHDAAYVFHFMALSPALYPFIVIGGILSLMLGALLSVACVILGGVPAWISWTMAAALIIVVPLWWFTTDVVSPGAGDNMIAVALASEVTRIFSESKKAGHPLLAHTRIVCLSVDAEESGLRGSMAYAARHGDEMTATKSYVLCFDTLYKADQLIFLNKDLNRTTNLSEAMARDLAHIAANLGYGARITGIPWGGGSTDAASFARAGIEATCLLAFDLNIKRLPRDFVYHTSRDTTDAIEPAMVKQALHVSVEYLLKKDSEAGRRVLSETEN